MNLVELATQSLEKFGEVCTDVFNDQEYTNLQMIKSANELANGLIKSGIKPGDKVIVMLMNTPEVLISYQGILRAGAIIIPVIYNLNPNEICNIINNSKAAAVITSKSLLYIINGIRDKIKTLDKIIILEDKEVPGTITYRKLISGCSDNIPDVDIDDESIAALIYTSGTSGSPKGVILTHKNLCCAAKASMVTKDHTIDNCVELVCVPLCGFFGIGGLNNGFLYPSKRISMSFFDLEMACKLIEKYKVTTLTVTPAIISHIVEHFDVVNKYDISSLGICLSGGAPLPVELQSTFESRFGCNIYEGYGLTESSGLIAFETIGKERKSGSVGQIVPGIEVKIVDNDNNEVPDNESGQLIVRGPTISPGYYKMPEYSENIFRNGWLYTGDIVKLDEDGFLYIVDRQKDLIITNGFNVVPRDVEEILYKNPHIREVAVVGVPDEHSGERIKAYIVLDNNADINDTDVKNHCRKYLAEYKCPKSIEFIDFLPRNPSGKILRNKLR